MEGSHLECSDHTWLDFVYISLKFFIAAQFLYPIIPNSWIVITLFQYFIFILEWISMHFIFDHVTIWLNIVFINDKKFLFCVSKKTQRFIKKCCFTIEWIELVCVWQMGVYPWEKVAPIAPHQVLVAKETCTLNFCHWVSFSFFNLDPVTEKQPWTCCVLNSETALDFDVFHFLADFDLFSESCYSWNFYRQLLFFQA